MIMREHCVIFVATFVYNDLLSGTVIISNCLCHWLWSSSCWSLLITCLTLTAIITVRNENNIQVRGFCDMNQVKNGSEFISKWFCSHLSSRTQESVLVGISSYLNVKIDFSCSVFSQTKTFAKRVHWRKVATGVSDSKTFSINTKTV